MTMTLEQEILEIAGPQPHDLEHRLSERFDNNFILIDKAINELRVAKTPRPRRPRRTAGAARMDPDDIRAGRVILTATLIFGLAAGAASFAGQIGLAPATQLPPYMWWVVPLFIDLPLAYLGWIALIFRRRKQSARRTWTVMIALTVLSSTINITHVLSGSGVIAGGPLTFETIMGCVIMGSAPLLIVYSWEEITKLLVKPTGEKRDPEVPAAPAKRPTPRKRVTKK